MLHLVGFLIFGFVVGVIARLLTPGRQHMTLLATTLLGMAGAIIAGWLGRVVGWYGPGDSAGFVTATVGAVVLLFGYDFIQRRRMQATDTTSSHIQKTEEGGKPSKAA